MISIPKLWADADGRHPLTEKSWVGQARLVPFLSEPAESWPEKQVAFLALAVPVPDELHQLLDCYRYAGRIRMVSFPHADSLIALAILELEEHAVITVMDLAGHPRLGDLAATYDAHRLHALATNAASNATPLLQIGGMTDLLREASAARRLEGQEVFDAIASIRADLRKGGAGALSVGVGRLRSLTLAVCQPL